MSKKKPRYLELNVVVDRRPARDKSTPEEVLEMLLDSLDEGAMTGDYSLPRGWAITVQWRNRPDVALKSGPWAQVQEDSAATGGWDDRMRAYLHGKLRQARKQLEERRARALESLDQQYRDRDAELRRQNERGELSDIRTTIERATLRRDYEAKRRELRGSDA